MKIPALLLASMVGLGFPLQAEEPDLAAQLRTMDQVLLDAIPVGGRAAWEREVAPDFVYVAEDGTVVDRADFLKALVPSPPFDVSPYRIHDHAVAVLGDVAVVVHHDDETGEYFGSRLTGQYLTTETWQRLDGAWKLRSVHTSAVPTNPPAVALTPAELDEVAGTYRAATEMCILRREGDRLLSKSAGGPEREWKAETRDTFFVPGRTRLRAVFRRDAAGKVTGFSWCNENRAVAYTRVD